MLSLPLISDFEREGPRDECGVTAIYTPDQPKAARFGYFALRALQHRGQEAAGISAWQDGRIVYHKNVGLVDQVFQDPAHLQRLSSDRVIGHVRYSTTGDSTPENAQPVHYQGPYREVAVAHNGNLVNAVALRRQLEAEGMSFYTTSDTEVIAALIASREGDLLSAAREAMNMMRGAYSLTILSEGKLLACRDRFGVRPLVIGMLGEEGKPGWVVASETCALDILGATYLRDVIPGEIVMMTGEDLETLQAHRPTPRPCVFEAIYFARPDSKLGSNTVYDLRYRLGIQLASEYPVEADAVTGVPESGHTMAVGFAKQSGIPYEDVFIKNRYVGRSFIEASDEERQMAIRMKLNAMPAIAAGKRLVVIDDSLIRGNTTRRVVQMLRAAGAVEVHMRIASPPARYPCHYGIDMGREGDYIAEGRSALEVAKLVGADTLHYLTPEGLSRAMRRRLGDRCTACFTGDYPIPPEEQGKGLLENEGISGEPSHCGGMSEA